MDENERAAWRAAGAKAGGAPASAEPRPDVTRDLRRWPPEPTTRKNGNTHAKTTNSADLDKVLEKSILDPFEIGITIDGLQERVRGRVSYDADQNLTLRLNTILNPADTQETIPEMPPDHRRIAGVLETGEYAILENPVWTNHRSATTYAKTYRPALSKSYRIDEMFVGGGVSDPETVRWAQVKFKGLLEWMNQQPFEIDGSGVMEDKFAIEYSNPEAIKIGLDDGSAMEISFLYDFSHPSIPAEVFTLPQSAAVTITAKSTAPFDLLYRRALMFNHLITLFTGAPMPLTAIRAGAGGLASALFGRYAVNGATRELDYLDFGLYYTDIRECFKDTVNDWFAFYDRHPASLDLYFDTWDRAGRMSSDVLFLRTVQSLEAFYAEDGGPYTRSLKTKLESLSKNHREILEPGENGERLARVAQVRNYYAHGTIPKPGEKIPGRAELAELISRLGLLVYANVFCPLSIPPDLKKKTMDEKIRQLERFLGPSQNEPSDQP